MKFRFAAFALAIAPLMAGVKLPAIIGDHMVLQRGVPARVFGWADAGERVTVQFNGQTVTGIAGSDRKWQVWLKPMNAGVSGEMSIRGNNFISLTGVLVGEVWVGSGQSNMQWTVTNSNNAGAEIANAGWPKIRLFRVPLKSTPAPQDDVEARWEVCSPEAIKEFSAVLYFFGRDLHKQRNVPFGLIQSAYGGTPAEAWTSKEALDAEPKLIPILAEWNAALARFPEESANYRKAIVAWEEKVKEAKANGAEPPSRPGPPRGPGHAHAPSGLFNAMINPLLPYTIKGAIWYQGESNATKTQAPLYRRLFESMITDWRAQWGIGDFPFLWVQLANFESVGSKNDWVLVQEAQTQTLELRGTGQAVINDIGEPKDIHPRNKQDVGARLALAARHVAYQEQLVYSGPRYRTATIETATDGGQGAKARVWFASAGGGLKTRGGGELKGFEIAGPDKTWVPAEARIDGATVVVSAPTVTDPKAVRYAWASWPDANLINAEGLPAGVFRWEGWK